MRDRTGVVRWALVGVVALVLALAGCGGAAESGSYVLFCNVTEPEDGGEVLSHFAEGMATTFTVD